MRVPAKLRTASLLAAAVGMTVAATPTVSTTLASGADTVRLLGVESAGVADTDPGFGSDNFQLVANVPHSLGGRGSDIEFASFTYANAAAAAAAGFVRAPGADAEPGVAGVQKDIAIAGTTGTAMYLYDVTDPAAVYEAAVYDCKANQGDSQVFQRTEGGVLKTYMTYTVEDSSAAAAAGSDCYDDADVFNDNRDSASGTFIIDITTPFAPVAVAHISVPEGSHNGTVHPSGNYFYNSNSSLYTDTAQDASLDTPGAGIEYYDISDFGNIERLGRMLIPVIPASLGSESHDITFNADGTRAYSAALSQGVIIDTTDPANPTTITNFVDPTINVWHQADPIVLAAGTADERTLLVVEDEVAGAIGTGQCPNGGVHVFDITGPLELAPVKLGYWNIDEARVFALDGSPALKGCTAHVFRLYPEAGVMTIAYYNGGTRVVDLNGLVGIGLGENAIVDSPISGSPMVQLGWRRFANSDEWAAKSPRITRAADGTLEPFTVFANGERGLDVIAFDGSRDAAAEAASNWMTQEEALQVLPRFTLDQLVANSEYVCFLS